MSYVRDFLTRRVPVDFDPNQRHALDVLSPQWGDPARRAELTEGMAVQRVDKEPPWLYNPHVCL